MRRRFDGRIAPATSVSRRFRLALARAGTDVVGADFTPALELASASGEAAETHKRVARCLWGMVMH